MDCGCSHHWILPLQGYQQCMATVVVCNQQDYFLVVYFFHNILLHVKNKELMLTVLQYAAVQSADPRYAGQWNDVRHVRMFDTAAMLHEMHV